MYKKILSTMVLSAILLTTILPTVLAYAVSTGGALPVTKLIPVKTVEFSPISEMIGSDCRLRLQGNRLVFTGEPNGVNISSGEVIGFTTVELAVIDAITPWTEVADVQIERAVTCIKGSVSGTAIDLSGLPDGTYNFQLQLIASGWYNCFVSGWEGWYNWYYEHCTGSYTADYLHHNTWTDLIITMKHGQASLALRSDYVGMSIVN